MPATSSLFGIKIHLWGLQKALEELTQIFLKKKQVFLVTLNPEMVVCSRYDQGLKRAIQKAELVLPDGIGVLLALKLLTKNRFKKREKRHKLERATGIDIVCGLAQRLQGKASFFLFGGSEKVVQQAAANLRQSFPLLSIAGVCNGYRYNSKDIIAAVNSTKADILLVALGSPLQEKWICHYLSQMPNVKIAIGVGGSFDFIAKKVKRAPLWMRRLGLEWFWRLLLEPWRIKRIYRAVIVFPCMVLKERFSFLGSFRS